MQIREARSRDKNSPRILVVTSVRFWEANRGCNLRIDSLVRFLTKLYPVTVCFIGQMKLACWAAAENTLTVPIVGPGQPALWQKHYHRLSSAVVSKYRNNTKKHWKNDIRKAQNHKHREASPKSLDSFYSKVIGRHVSKLVRKLKIDVVIIEYVMLAYIADFIRRDHPGTAIALDTHDVMHLRKRDFVRFNHAHWLDIDRDMEADSLKKFDAVIAIQNQDASEIATMAPQQLVIVAPYGCEPEAKGYKYNRNTGAGSSLFKNEKPTVGFLGSDAIANQIGLKEFLNHCWPTVYAKLDGNVEMLVGGTIVATGMQGESWPNTRFTGEISDLSQFYDQVDVTINPSLIRSGLKIKGLESMARGVPHITTAFGAAGLEMAAGKGIGIANDWTHFAEILVDLLRDSEMRMEWSGSTTKLIKQFFIPEAAYASICAWLNSLK